MSRKDTSTIQCFLLMLLALTLMHIIDVSSAKIVNEFLDTANFCWNQPDYTTYTYVDDCSKYLQCHKGKLKLQSCPNGWLYNSKLKLCDDVMEDECSMESINNETTTTLTGESENLCKDKLANSTLPYPEDCQWYYLCGEKGLNYLLPCPINNYYDPYSGNCSSQVSPTTCQDLETTAGTMLSTLSPSEKCVDQNVGITYPYEANCKKYIYCNGKGGFLLINCPDNNYYYPDTGDCGPSDDPEICLKGLTTTEATTIIVTATTLSPSEKCVNQSVGATHPYEENCQQYIYCNGKGGFVLINCPYNSYYYPDSGDCGPSDDPEICLKVSITTEATTTIAIETTLSSCEKCVDQEMGMTFAYEENCQQYIFCNGKGGYILLNCPNNNYYDPHTGNCGPPELVSPTACKDLITTTTSAVTTLSPSEKCSDQDVGTTFPYEENCQKYIYCNGKGGFILINCPFNNFYYPDSGDCGPSDDPEICLKGSITEATTTIVTPTTLSPSEKCVDQDMGVTYPYEENCQQYIYCNGKGGYMLLNCPYNNYYYPDSGDCGPSDDPEICLRVSTTTSTEAIISTTSLRPSEKCVGQDMGVTYPYEENCQQYIFCNGKGGFFILNCPCNNYYYPDSGDCAPSDDPEICLKGSTTITTEFIETTEITTNSLNNVCTDQPEYTTLPYPEDCQRYYFCREKGLYYILSCPPNNYYDPYSGNCGPSELVSPTACQDYITTTETMATTLSPSEKCYNENMGTTFAYKSNCQQYIYCDGKGGFLLINCPYNNYYYPDSGDCGPSDDPAICLKELTAIDVTTNSIPTALPSIAICSNASIGRLVEYPGNCRKFIRCIKPIPIAFPCNENEYFNKEQQKCMTDLQGYCSA